VQKDATCKHVHVRAQGMLCAYRNHVQRWRWRCWLARARHSSCARKGN
jgi:hypothetical protein